MTQKRVPETQKWCQSHQHFTRIFLAHRSRKHKKTLIKWLSFCAFGIRALHSKLLTKLSRRFLSLDEFLRVKTGRVERHYFRNFLPKLAITNNTKNAIFRDFWWFFRNFLRFLESEWVRTSSEGSDITKIFLKFEKSQFPKLAKMKILEKNRLSRGLIWDLCV